MLTEISGKGLSKKHNVLVTSFAGGTREKIIENLDNLLKNKSEDMLIQVGAKDITSGAY